MMKRSYELLKNHPVNISRMEQGLSPANAIWLWGQGSRPQLANFKAMTGLKGSIISAVDLLKGIGRIAGMEVCQVPGATGYIDTNYTGKMEAALKELRRGQDYVYIHVEAPDECGHRGEVQNKVKAIEDIDRLILAPLLDELDAMGEDYSLLIMPDHPTPLAIRTHDASPVPYLLYRSHTDVPNTQGRFTEKDACTSGLFIEPGFTILEHFIK